MPSPLRQALLQDLGLLFADESLAFPVCLADSSS